MPPLELGAWLGVIIFDSKVYDEDRETDKVGNLVIIWCFFVCLFFWGFFVVVFFLFDWAVWIFHVQIWPKDADNVEQWRPWSDFWSSLHCFPRPVCPKS